MMPGRGEILASHILDELERDYQEIGEKLNSYPPGKTVCHVFNAPWQKGGGIFVAAGNPAVTCNKEIYYRLPYSDERLPPVWLRVFSHEYGHIAFQNAAGTYYLPFEEGFIYSSLDRTHFSAEWFVKQLVRSGLASSLENPRNIKWTTMRRSILSLRLMGERRGMRLLTDSQTLTQFLVAKFGWEKVGEIPGKLRSGMNLLEAIEAITNLTSQELEKEWLTFVSERYGDSSKPNVDIKDTYDYFLLWYVWGGDKVSQANYLAGLIAMREGEFLHALKHLKEVLTISPFDPGLHLYLARAHYSVGENEKACLEYEKAIRLNPDDQTIKEEAERLSAGSQGTELEEKWSEDIEKKQRELREFCKEADAYFLAGLSAFSWGESWH
jgi:hypothetical protein